MANPLRAMMNIRREEVPLTLSMFTYFFLVISSFWILKPIKKALFISFYDTSGITFLPIHRTAAQGELIAKVLNMFVALLAVVVFTWLARRFRRQQLTYIFTAFSMACYIFYSFRIGNPGDVTVWGFYLFGDLFNTLMVATFFAFLNDSVTPESSKRLYGVIVLGGVLGGVFGSTFVGLWIEELSMATWLWICFLMALGILGAAKAAGVLVGRNPPEESKPPVRTEDPEPKGNIALQGARLVWRSPYLLSIVAVVGLYEVASTIVDFMFTSTVSHYLDGPAIGLHFSRVFAITNWVSMVVQLFLTSFIMSRLGVGAALLILPVAVASVSAGFLAFPILWVGSFLNTADNGFSYSVNQSAKEALYVPTTREEKYNAKAFIDMFAQRFAKAVAVLVSLVITTMFTDSGAIRWLSVIVIAIAFAWVAAARYAGREFCGRTE